MRRADVVRVYERCRRAVAGAPPARRAPAGGKGAPPPLAGVKLPALLGADKRYTVTGLCLVFFAKHLGEIKTKSELVGFLGAMSCPTTDPQPRHLGMQHGFNFLVKGCFHPVAKRVLKCGEYSLLDLAHRHPSFANMHRVSSVAAGGFSRIKKAYGGRCAVCGSVEGERHLKNSHMVTALEKGHCDPRQPLTQANCIPMCTLCNQVYKDRAVFNRRGFVVRWLHGKDAEGGDKAVRRVCVRVDAKPRVAPPARRAAPAPAPAARRKAAPADKAAAPPPPSRAGGGTIMTRSRARRMHLKAEPGAQ